MLRTSTDGWAGTRDLNWPSYVERLARYAFAASAVRGMNVLEITTGFGNGAALFKVQGAASVTVFHLSEEAHATPRQAGQKGDVRHFVGGVEKIADTFSGGTFDVIVCFDALDSMEGPEKILSGCRKLGHGKSHFLCSVQKKSTSDTGLSYLVSKGFSHNEYMAFLERYFPAVLILEHSFYSRPVIAETQECHSKENPQKAPAPFPGLDQPTAFLATCSYSADKSQSSPWGPWRNMSFAWADLVQAHGQSERLLKELSDLVPSDDKHLQMSQVLGDQLRGWQEIALCQETWSAALEKMRFALEAENKDLKANIKKRDEEFAQLQEAHERLKAYSIHSRDAFHALAQSNGVRFVRFTKDVLLPKRAVHGRLARSLAKAILACPVRVKHLIKKFQ